MKLIALVNNKDRKIGEVSRTEAHRLGLLHRVSYVVIFTKEGKIILQRRSFRKKFLPGKWLAISGGHVDLGESYRQAAVRELREEMGINAEPADLIDFKIKKLCDLTNLSGFPNREFISVFALVYDPKKHGKIKINRLEVIGFKEVQFAKLPRIVAHFPKSLEQAIMKSIKRLLIGLNKTEN